MSSPPRPRGGSTRCHRRVGAECEERNSIRGLPERSGGIGILIRGLKFRWGGNASGNPRIEISMGYHRSSNAGIAGGMAGGRNFNAGIGFRWKARPSNTAHGTVKVDRTSRRRDVQPTCRAMRNGRARTARMCLWGRAMRALAAPPPRRPAGSTSPPSSAASKTPPRHCGRGLRVAHRHRGEGPSRGDVRDANDKGDSSERDATSPALRTSDSGLALDDGCERDLGLFSRLTSSLTPAT